MNNAKDIPESKSWMMVTEVIADDIYKLINVK